MKIEEIEVTRLDHLGVVSGTIKRLGIVEYIDSRIAGHSQEAITVGEGVAGLIINGLGFSHRPLYLVPQFFENKPLDILFRPGVEAAHFNRFKLGRVLDELHEYGSSLLFSEIALLVCDKEGISTQYQHLDSSSFVVTGEYASSVDKATDEEATAVISLKHGYSKDHRPDLKQVVLELIVSQDGGVPLMCQAWDGNASDNTIFKERSEALVKQLTEGDSPRYLIADSKLYTEANAVNLARLPYITRIPESIKRVSEQIAQAWQMQAWQSYGDKQYQCFQLTHYDIKQRWLVVYSPTSWQRAVKQVNKAGQKEADTFAKALFHLQAQHFETPNQAVAALQNLFKKSHYHQLTGCQLTLHFIFAQKGRPAADAQPIGQSWQITATCQLDPQRQQTAYQQHACFVIGSNASPEQLTNTDLLDHYAQQDQAERGFRFLKDPFFFTSAFFVKLAHRLQALLMVMTLALLVYAVAQRHLRQQLAQQQATLPNQIGQPTATPTLRWLFQALDGIDCLRYRLDGQTRFFIHGLSPLKIQILTFFGPEVACLYHLSP
jgi:transposase